MTFEELDQLRVPENFLKSSVGLDFAATFQRVRPVVERIYAALPEKDYLLRRSRYGDVRDLVRYQSERLAQLFVEDRHREAEQEGSLTTRINLMVDVIRDSIFQWIAPDNPSDVYDIANDLLDKRFPGRGPKPAWLPDMRDVIDAERSMRHLGRNALAARAIERKPHAHDFSAERVIDSTLADTLWQDRQGVYRSIEIAQAILAKYSGNLEPIQKVWKKVGEDGAFLERQGPDDLRKEIENPDEHVIFRAKGKPVIREVHNIGTIDAPKMLETFRVDEKFRWGSDVRIKLPKDDPGADLAFSLKAPPGGEFIYRKGQRVADMIRKNHAIAGCVTDLRVSDEYAHMGYAGAVRYAALQYIHDQLNRKRLNKIRFLIAEIFSVNGLYLPNGTYLPLETPISNIASQIAHTHGRTPAFDGWERVGDRVPVWLPGDLPEAPHYLDVSWMAMIHDMELIAANWEASSMKLH